MKHLSKYLCLLLGLALLNPMFLLRVEAQSAASGFQIPATDDGLPGEGPIRRYEWFKRLWERKRSQWAKDVTKDQGALVFLGDSITQGWGPEMKGMFPGVKVANRGISGDTTRGVLIRMKEDVLSLNPSGVVLLIGTNDLEEGAAPEIIASNLGLILSELKKHDSSMPIVLSLVFPSSASKKRPADKIQKINELYLALVKGDEQVTAVETWRLFANEAGDAVKAEFPDLLHPNDAGYRKWAAALKPILATEGFLEKEADVFTPEPGFRMLFNGKDLTGWGFREKKTLKKQEQFDGKKASGDGRYEAIHGRLVVTTPPEYRRIQQLWTTGEFGRDFTLKLEFRATPYADSGVFVRKPQLQCRDYPLAGPYTDLKGYKAQDWNELVIRVRGNLAHCTCNGEILNEAMKLPASGPIGLEGDRGQMEYRRIRIRMD